MQTRLTSIDIPNSVTKIGDHAFSAAKITNVKIPSSVSSIGINPFHSNPIKTIEVDEKNQYFMSPIEKNAIYTKDGTELVAGTLASAANIKAPTKKIKGWAFRAMGLTTLKLPANVTHIDESAFAENKITSITWPDKLTIIGDGAFRNNKLVSVSMPDSITSIGNSPFGYNHLQNVTIGSSVKSIGLNAFEYNRLSKVIIPASLEIMPNSNPFIGNPDLATIVVDKNNKNFSSTNLNNAIYTKDETELIVGTRFMSNNIKETTKVIRKNAFANETVYEATLHGRGTERPTSVTIPDSVTQIGAFAFQNHNFTHVTIPASVKDIGNGTFYTHNSALQSAKFSSSSTVIGSNAFVKSSPNLIIIGHDPSTAKDFATTNSFAFRDINKLTVRYDGNGNTGGDVPVDNMTYKSGAEVTLLDNTDKLEKEGYIFDGWNSSENGFGIDYAVNSKFNLFEDMTLYAKWTVNKTAVTIDAIGDIHVPVGTTNINLPPTVRVTLSDATTPNVPITWDAGAPTFDGNTPSNYLFTGTLTLPTDVTNPNILQAKVNVIVVPPAATTTVDNIETIVDLYIPVGTTNINLPPTVRVTLSDATTPNVPITWDAGAPTFDGNTPSNYLFTGTLTLPTNVTNPNILQAKVNVIVVPPAATTTVDSIETIGDLYILVGTTNINLPPTVGVTLSDATTPNVPITWDAGAPTFDGNTPGN